LLRTPVRHLLVLLLMLVVGPPTALAAQQESEPALEPAPASVEVAASAPPIDPRAYLYQQAPELASRLDCIIALESGWEPSSQNPWTRASGLAQFLPSTWARTPQGRAGLSVFDPLANIDGAIWLARTAGLTQWGVYALGACRG
jgi:Transglycosylase SLT domain